MRPEDARGLLVGVQGIVVIIQAGAGVGDEAAVGGPHARVPGNAGIRGLDRTQLRGWLKLIDAIDKDEARIANGPRSIGDRVEHPASVELPGDLAARRVDEVVRRAGRKRDERDLAVAGDAPALGGIGLAHGQARHRGEIRGRFDTHRGIVALAYVNVGLAVEGTIPPSLIAVGTGFLVITIAFHLVMRTADRICDMLYRVDTQREDQQRPGDKAYAWRDLLLLMSEEI